MINKVISASKLLHVKIVESVCVSLASLDLGDEGIHHAVVVVVVSESLNFNDKGENPVDVVAVPHAVVVVSESLDLGNKGENYVAVALYFNRGSIQSADTVSCSPKKPVVVVVSCNNGSIQRAPTIP